MRRAPDVACTVASLAVAGASALPWSQFGAVRRSGYGLATIARQAGLLNGWAQQAVAVAWFTLPLLAALCLAAAVGGVRLAAAAMALLCAALGSVCVAAVLLSPIDHEVGVWVGLAAAVSALAAAGWAFSRARSRPIPGVPGRPS